jgi:CsoR family transcriptional regulator, copper-sensing transcriptional repressor
MPNAATTVNADRARSHDQAIQTRIRKAAGQLNGVATMHAQGRHCVEVLDQLAAVTAALDEVALLVLREHVEACVREAIAAANPGATVSELLAAVRRYVRSH